jgi:phytoene desaturase
MKKKIAIIWGGPGGLSAAMLLSQQGHEVDIYEKDEVIGGRNSRLTLAEKYHFDVGPTFLLMKPFLDEIFEKSGRKSSDYIDFRQVDPMYELHFSDISVSMTSDHEKMRSTISKLFPGEEIWFDRYLAYEDKRLEKMYPCLDMDYSKLSRIIKKWKHLIEVIPYLSLGKSVYQVLSGYFTKEELKLCFTFQAKYLGMSPWNCPGFFSMLAYSEHKYGIYHTIGWLSEISEAMVRVAQENGATLHLKSPIKKVITQNGIATGVQLETDEIKQYDSVVINVDFGTAMTQLFDEKDVRKYSAKKLSKKWFSCSTFMVYLALDKLYDLPFHSIYFAKEYRDQLDKIHHNQPIGEKDFSFYVRNASILDKTLAPEWHSWIYMLIPVSNLRSGESWNEIQNSAWYETALKMLESRVWLSDIRNHIVASETINPKDWENRGVYMGATFNLSHSLSQMLYFRPHNEFECVTNCYLVGGGTHPGSGLPTIYESAKIVAEIIEKK